MSLTGKVIAISGGASGIGLGTARVLLSRGAHVSIADISPDSIASANSVLSSQFPADKILAVVCDVGDAASVRDWIATTVSRFGRLDGAANVAATQGRTGTYDSRIVSVDHEDWDHIIRVNLTGVMYCVQEQLRAIQRHGEGGSIVNVSSYVVARAGLGAGAYCAAKAGVLGLTRSVAREMGPEGIRCNAVLPGNVDTPMMDQVLSRGGDFVHGDVAKTPIARMGRPEELGTVIAHLLSDDASYVTGTVQLVDGGLLA
ncbi:(S,S)-butanediol dehydrogenase [Microdochium nivale]|nr:(S,S)-butanediol dehydrogenase [Microdochium nivale]